MSWEVLKAATLRSEELAAFHQVRLLKTVTTNGTLVTDEKAKWLKAHSFVPAVSIDGDRSMHGIHRHFSSGQSSFDEALSGAKSLLSQFPDIEVIIVVTPENISGLSKGIRYLCDELNVRRISVNPDFYVPWSEESLEIMTREFDRVGSYFVERYQKHTPVFVNFIDGKIITRIKGGFEDCDRCGFGMNEIAVAPSGRIYPCERLVGDDTNEEMCIGNVFDGFNEEQRQKILSNKGCVNSECSQCSIRNRCMNWCCCINYGITGHINVTDGLVCFHEQLAVKVADEVGSLLFQEKNPLFLCRHYGEKLSAPSLKGD